VQPAHNPFAEFELALRASNNNCLLKYIMLMSQVCILCFFTAKPKILLPTSVTSMKIQLLSALTNLGFWVSFPISLFEVDELVKTI
jgi:hypothetical protein